MNRNPSITSRPLIAMITAAVALCAGQVSAETIVYNFNDTIAYAANLGAGSPVTTNDFSGGITGSNWTAVSPIRTIGVQGGQVRALKSLDTDTHTFTITIPDLGAGSVDLTTLSFNFGTVGGDTAPANFTVSSNRAGGTITPNTATHAAVANTSASASMTLAGTFTGINNTSITFTLTDAAQGDNKNTYMYTWIDNVTLTGTFNADPGDPPGALTLTPDGVSNVLVSSDLVATFDEPVALTGSGTVTLRNLTLGSGSDIVITLPDAQVSVAGPNLTINPTAPLAVGTDFAVRISNDAIKDVDDNNFAGILDDTTWTFSTAADGTNPTLSATVPADNAPGVAVESNLVATFSEDIVAGAGNITIKNLTDATETVIAVTNGSLVSISGTDLTINPAANLLAGKDYAIQIHAGAIKDLTGNSFAGILNNDDWSFTTLTDITAPTITTTTPTNGASGVLPNSNLVATFNENVVLVDAGTVTLRNLTLGSGSDVVITLPNSQVSVSGAVMTINPSANLDNSTNYAVQISADAVKDLATNPFGGITDDTTWAFTTGAAPSGGLLVTPNHLAAEPTYAIIGSLRAVDVPYQGTTFPIPGPVGSDWPENADDGWSMLAGSNLEANHGTSPWEPDGTPLGEAQTLRLNSEPGSTYTFNLPDGTVINAIYATWLVRSTSGAVWSYTEGAANGSLNRTMTTGPAGNLVLSWTDAASGAHQGNFERLFVGPITVEGGNGFTLKAVRTGNTHQADAVILDIGTDTTAPQLTSIVDNVGGGPVTVGDTVTYTVSFNENMNDTTVTEDDFNNAGSSTISFGSITEIRPGVFTVPVTPTSAGDLILQIPVTASLTDSAGNPLDNDPALVDDTPITVNASSNVYVAWSGGAAADIDTNGDGVENGVAWALGALDPNANAIGLLPTMANTDPTYLLFTFNRSDEANGDPNTAITVEYGNDLVGWITAVDDNDNVEIEETGGSPTDAVVVKLKRSTLGASGQIFVRLKVVVTP